MLSKLSALEKAEAALREAGIHPDDYFWLPQLALAVELERPALITRGSYHHHLAANAMLAVMDGETTLRQFLIAAYDANRDLEGLSITLGLLIPVNEAGEDQLRRARIWLDFAISEKRMVEGANKCADLMNSILDIARAGARRA